MPFDVLKRPLGSSLLSRRLADLGAGRLIVLCYHDLRGPTDLTSWLRVEVNTFRAHLAALSRIGDFVSPAALDAAEGLPDHRLHFLLTFDDGYANNLRLGAAALEEAGTPALFFISTHHLTTGEPFWFDRVVTRIQAASVTKLDLSKLGMRAYTFAAQDGRRRWEGIQALLADLKRLGNADHPSVVAVLRLLDSQYGEAAAPHDRWYRPLTVPELKELVGRPLIHVGSHAHRHHILTFLDAQALAESLSSSREILEQLVARTIDHFAYPNGDENEEVRTACRAAGYRKAYVARAGMVPSRPDFWRIPRLLVGGYDSVQDLLSRINVLLVGSRLRSA